MNVRIFIAIFFKVPLLVFDSQYLDEVLFIYLDFPLCHQRVLIKVLLKLRFACSETLSPPIQVIAENKVAESLMLFQLTASVSWNHNGMDVEREVCSAP